MNDQTVFTFAKWKVKESQQEKVLELLGQVASETSKEVGNVFYNVHVSISDPNTVVLWEAYTDEQAVEAHRASDHFQNIVIQQILPLLEQREVILARQVL